MFSKKTGNKTLATAPVLEGLIKETRMLVRNLRRLYAHRLLDSMKIMHQCSLLIGEINKFILLVPQPLEYVEKQSEEPAYLMSSLFLKDCFEFLNQRDVESMHFVTGPEIGKLKVLDKIVNFKLEKQSIAFAKADAESLRKTLIHLSKYKFELWGYFHIHPGTGAGSTFQSGIDLDLEKLLDRGGYEAIGAIFSRDGFIRFFSSKNFKIQIYGEGVKKVNENLYHLVEIS